MWVLLIGNPVEGFTITGTFTSTEDASHYGDRYIDNNLEWWIMEVNPASWANKLTEPEVQPEPQITSEIPNVSEIEDYIRTGNKH